MGRRLFSWIWLIVLLCAKEMKTHNHTYSHFIRINTWHDSDKSSQAAPVPVLARSSLCADDDPSCVQRTVTKRQVDPLHSCIEAKCSSWNSGNYLDCVYRHCVTGFQMHGKRSVDDDEPDPDAFGHPEGRFLLLPVSFQSPDGETQLFPPSVQQASDEVDEALRARAARARLVRRRISAWRQHGQHRANRMKRNAAVGHDEVRADSLAARLRAMRPPKRSYNDIADVCVEHHCGHLPPHSISYFQCVEHHCTGKKL